VTEAAVGGLEHRPGRGGVGAPGQARHRTGPGEARGAPANGEHKRIDLAAAAAERPGIRKPIFKAERLLQEAPGAPGEAWAEWVL